MLKKHLLCLFVISSIEYVVGKRKSSLTYVIDNTASMHDDIAAVIDSAHAIYDTVMANNASQIENFVLVTFNDIDDDPGVIVRAVTTNREIFKSQLDAITVYGGGDCPEYSLSGIKRALEESLPGSSLYVFTDATAKDYAEMYEEVKSIAQSKQCQIVFVLTGQCSQPDSSPDYQVYHKLSEATDGEVFHLKKDEVKIILDYVKNNVKGRRSTIVRKTLPPGKSSFTYPADPKSDDTTLSLASTKKNNPSIDVTAPDGSKAEKIVLIHTDRIKIYSINVTKPGIHKVEVDSETETRALLSARTTVNFLHGFSTFIPISFDVTSTKPAPDVNTYLSIKLTEGDVKVIAAKILDLSDNVILELPMSVLDDGTKLFVSEQFKPPTTMFRISIVAQDPEGKYNITRTAPTPVEVQKILPGKVINNKIPMVVIEGGAKINAKYEEPLQLICAVEGYPKPEIIWRNKIRRGVVLANEVLVKELPYDYIAVYEIRSVKENATYTCEAKNSIGSDIKEVTVQTIRKRYFNILDTPRKTNLEFGTEGKLQCLVDAYPPAEIYWYRNSKELLPSTNIDISSNKSTITIKRVTLADKGKYTCEVRNEDNRKLIVKSVVVTGIDRPIIDKSIPSMSVKKGESIEMECNVIKGKPEPKINWYYKKAAASEKFVKIREWEGLNKVKVINAVQRDTGTYQCLAENEISYDDYEIDLVVEYPPTIAIDVKTIKAAVGSDVSISCNVDGGPTPFVTWYKDGVKITRSENIHIFGNYTLRFVAKKSYSGSYTCKAANRLAVAKKTAKLDVIVPVTIVPPKESNLAVLVGSKLTLPCKANGDPKPEIKWIYRSLDSSKSTSITIESPSEDLDLHHIQVNEEGYYTCVASNIGGSKNLTYTVQVFAPPIIENTYKSKHFLAVEGDLALRINCKASGNPKPTIKWTKDGWNLALGSTYYLEEGTLVIRNVPSDASGIYRCEAVNIKGVDQEIYQVSVEKYPPPASPKSSVLIEEGKPINIKCNLPHTKIDILRWYKNGEIISSGELTLTNPSPRDSGLYTCRVSDFFKSVSEHIKVGVGHKPEFTTKEDENIEMVKGPPVALVCEAIGIPEPTMEWYHNDVKLDWKEPVYYFPNGVTKAGQYRCEAKNIFGTISRPFTATPRDCFINVKKLTKLQPLMVSSRLTWPMFETSGDFLIFPKGEQFVLFCPHRFKMFPRQYITAFCNGGMNIMVNGKDFDYADIQCTEEMKHKVIKTGEKCLPGDTEKVKIMYNLLGYENTEVYEICLNKTSNTPLFAKHIMPMSVMNNVYDSPWSDGDEFSIDFDDAYNCTNQIYYASAWLGRWFHKDDGCCYSKRQLVNPRDVFPGVAQRSTFSYFNVVPQWSSCNADNWNAIEDKVRNFSMKSYSDLLVFTGTAKDVALPSPLGSINKFFTDRKGYTQPVPMFLWKVIQDPASGSSLAIIQVNVPDLSTADIPKYVLCKDICHHTEWMNSPNWHDTTRGYTYCCSLQEFERSFGFRGIFESDMTNVLISDADLLPESSFTV